MHQMRKNGILKRSSKRSGREEHETTGSDQTVFGKEMSWMDLREQKYVCALAECGNLTRAAEKLFISQPALSIYITNLEKSMGVSLFDRSGKKFTLSPEALVLWAQREGRMH